MEGQEFKDVPLSSLTKESRNKLTLLNTKRAIRSDGPKKLPRDWRGMANLAGISTQAASNFRSKEMDCVLNHWIEKNDGTATVYQLFRYLEEIDRYDLRDDLLELAEEGMLVDVRQPDNQVALNDQELEPELMTMEELRVGAEVCYDAVVLFADEDRPFFEEMLRRATARGFSMCTKDNLIPGQMMYKPMANVIAERCKSVILVYSPDFFKSRVDTFFMEIAQAFNIQSGNIRLIPCMLHECTLPNNFSIYHNLYVNSNLYDFWDHLFIFLGRFKNEVRNSNAAPVRNRAANKRNQKAIKNTSYNTSEASSVKIQEVSQSTESNCKVNGGYAETDTIKLPDIPSHALSTASSLSMTDLPSTNRLIQDCEAKSLHNVNRKKSSFFRKAYKFFKGRNKKLVAQ